MDQIHSLAAMRFLTGRRQFEITGSSGDLEAYNHVVRSAPVEVFYIVATWSVPTCLGRCLTAEDLMAHRELLNRIRR